MRSGQFRMKVVPAVLGLGLVCAVAGAQDHEEHGRKWKPMPPTAHIVVTVEKAFNGKPIANAGVVFHAFRNGKDDGNLEVKTDPDGRAVMDLIEVGSHVEIQVIARGFATEGRSMDVTGPNAEMLIKVQRPRAQVSQFETDEGQAAQVKPGIQYHVPGELAKDKKDYNSAADSTAAGTSK